MLKLYTDSDTDVTPKVAKEHGYSGYISMPYSVDAKTIHPYEDFKTFDCHGFYDMLRSGEKNKQAKIREFSEYNMGASSTTDIWQAQNFAERGFDGLVQVKSACFMPETDIMPVLANLSRDYKIPVLYLTYDSQTSDVGLMTRLEAFFDMLEMRKKVAR